MKVVSGVLEHIIFLLMEKSIKYELNIISREEGFQEQIVVKFNNMFIYIVKHEKRIAYYFAEKGQDRRSISKVEIVRKIKEIT